MLLPSTLLQSTQMALSVKESKVHSDARIEVVIHVFKNTGEVPAVCLTVIAYHQHADQIRN